MYETVSNVLFIAIWLPAIVCPLLPWRFLSAGAALFLACQCLLWFGTFSAMSSPTWNDSPGDMLVPAIVTLPVVLFAVILIVRGSFVLTKRICRKRDLRT